MAVGHPPGALADREVSTIAHDVAHTHELAMARALELAARGPVYGPNPRVGCVLLAADGAPLAEGWHAGAGTPHAEAVAVARAREAGHDLRGATAVVTLEPCAHTGRTGPCADLLLEAGVARAVVAVPAPTPLASGGAERLRAGGVEVVEGVRRAEGEALLEVWLHAVRLGRPFVTLKTATSLDGRVAAADGSSRWITSEESRAHAHRLRAEMDAIVVGTGTALQDDPSLTARTAEGDLTAHQPLRVVVGGRDLPAGARLHGPGGELVQIRTHEPRAVLQELAVRGVRHVLVEGGPTVAAAFLAAGLVDEVHAYVAPVLLGAGPAALADLGVRSIGDALRLESRGVEVLGPDVLIRARPRAASRVTTASAPSSAAPSAAQPTALPAAQSAAQSAASSTQQEV